MGFMKGLKNAVTGNHSHKEPKHQPAPQQEVPKRTSTIKQIFNTTASVVKTTASVGLTTTKVIVKTGAMVAKGTAMVAKPIMKASANVIAPNPHQVQEQSQGLAIERRQWFKDLGFKVLAKIYEPNATPGSPHHAGSIASSFANASEDSNLQDKSVKRPLYHQENRHSVTKVVKKVNRFFRGDPAHIKARQDYLTQVAGVVCAAQEQAKQNGENFERGSIKIKDPGGKLFAYLKGYVQFATGKENPGFLFSSNDFAYSRDPNKKLSSHYTEFETEQYGIDMRLSGAAPTLEILPNKGDSHLLFGRIKINNEWHTFIKGEPAGLGHPLEYLEHAKHFLLPKKHHGVSRKESEIPKPLKDAYGKFHSAHGGVKAKTVADMYQQIVNANDLSEKALRAREKFLEGIEQLNFTQDILIRTGNEVILDFQPFEQAPLVQPHQPVVPPVAAFAAPRPIQPPTMPVAPVIAPIQAPIVQRPLVPQAEYEPIARRLRSKAVQPQQPVQAPLRTVIQVPPVPHRPSFKPNLKLCILGGILGIAGLGLVGLPLGPFFTALYGFVGGFLVTLIPQNERINAKYNGLTKFDDKSINSLKYNKTELDIFELGVSAATSYQSQAKSVFWLSAYGYSEAYYAGMAAKEAGRDDVIAKVASARRLSI